MSLCGRSLFSVERVASPQKSNSFTLNTSPNAKTRTLQASYITQVVFFIGFLCIFQSLVHEFIFHCPFFWQTNGACKISVSCGSTNLTCSTMTMNHQNHKRNFRQQQGHSRLILDSLGIQSPHRN